MSERRNQQSRRTGARRLERSELISRMVARLRMQARTRASSHRVMRVEPGAPEKFLEWEAADLLERLK